MRPFVLASGLTRLAALLPLVVLVPTAVVGAGPCWTPPVDAPVIDPFRAPACPWCPGNRGIEYGPRADQPVRAVADGVVRFAGTVVGTRYVVVEHRDGVRATYGRLRTITAGVTAGSRVAAGTTVGTTGTAMYFGLRRGDAPVDPTPLLGALERTVRLIPLDGTSALPAPAPRLVCGNDRAGG